MNTGSPTSLDTDQEPSTSVSPPTRQSDNGATGIRRSTRATRGQLPSRFEHIVFWLAVFTLINYCSTLHFTELHRTLQIYNHDLPFWDEITRERRIAPCLVPRTSVVRGLN